MLCCLAPARIITSSHYHCRDQTILPFFFKDTAPTEIYTAQYTLSLHDALPIFPLRIAHGDDRVALQRPLDAEARVADRKSTRLNSSHIEPSRMPSSA